MYTLNINYRNGQTFRIMCAEHDARRACAELSRASDVASVWVEQS